MTGALSTNCQVIHGIDQKHGEAEGETFALSACG